MIGTKELKDRIRAVHGPELSEMMHGLLGQDPGPVGLQARTRLGRIGPVPSVAHERTLLTVVADLEDLRHFSSAPTLQGSCVTINFAAHRRHTGTAVPVQSNECQAWVEAFLGEAVMTHVYWKDTARSDVYYRVFFNSRRRPIRKPVDVIDGTVPLRGVS